MKFIFSIIAYLTLATAHAVATDCGDLSDISKLRNIIVPVETTVYFLQKNCTKRQPAYVANASFSIRDSLAGTTKCGAEDYAVIQGSNSTYYMVLVSNLICL